MYFLLFLAACCLVFCAITIWVLCIVIGFWQKRVRDLELANSVLQDECCELMCAVFQARWDAMKPKDEADWWKE